MEQITVNMYFNMVQHLDFRSKLELMSMISNSLLNSTLKNTEDKEQLLKGAFGGFVSDESADEMIENLRAARMFNRPDVCL